MTFTFTKVFLTQVSILLLNYLWTLDAATIKCSSHLGLRSVCLSAIGLLGPEADELQIKSVPKRPGAPCSCADRADSGRRAGRASFRWAAWCRDCGSPSLVDKDKV